MTDHTLASRNDWLAARQRLLAREKELTLANDRLSEERRALPWVELEKKYLFDTIQGKKTLSELFAGRSQLVVYHFMFAPEREAGCHGCSFWADNFNGIIPHLNARDITFVAVSRGPLAKLEAYKQRLGWSFDWVSAQENDFNQDFAVSFTAEQAATKERLYNFGSEAPGAGEKPGISVFVREGRRVFHTYSCYARGLEMMNTAYHYIDLAPKGRDEQGSPMGWLKRRDEYAR